MKRREMSTGRSQAVFRNSVDNGRDRPHPQRGGYRL